jgi:hypothetical protein
MLDILLCFALLCFALLVVRLFVKYLLQINEKVFQFYGADVEEANALGRC